MDYLRELAGKFLRRLPMKNFLRCKWKITAGRLLQLISPQHEVKVNGKCFEIHEQEFGVQLGCSLASLKGSDTKQTVLDEQVVRETKFGTRWEIWLKFMQVYLKMT